MLNPESKQRKFSLSHLSREKEMLFTRCNKTCLPTTDPFFSLTNDCHNLHPKERSSRTNIGNITNIISTDSLIFLQ